MSGYGFKRGEGKTLPIEINKDNAIARGRYINRIEYRKTDKAEYLTIEVRDKAGNTARKSYFPPKIGSGFVQTTEQLEKEQHKFNRTIENLTSVLLSPSYETGPVATFEEFCNRIISDIGKSYFDKELRIKLVLDKKNYPTLPAWPIIFEDPSVVSDTATKMKITQWDKVEATAIEMDKEDTASDKKDDDLSDLPF